ncbi:MAG: tRNA pseudouridine(54/55) synthase Pus10 [Thermoplasmata archaeon]|nr:MAG: tRNA pseudouridine(54/55) synthase Pus10 [Thermoplasmata archaeon]
MTFIDLVDMERARKAAHMGLCHHCLGRLFAKVGHGMSNMERGEKIWAALIQQYEEEEGARKAGSSFAMPETCCLCENLFSEVDKFSDLIVKKLLPYEYDTFLVGSKVDFEVMEREEQLWGRLGCEHYEPIKAEINREVGKLVEHKVEKKVEFERPDITAVIDTRFDSVELQIASLFIYGRYRKLERGIPQTRWPCRACWGKGCVKCNQTGKMYQTSVEEIIAKEVMEATEGEEHSFHGMGREDIDARMLGSGRPFVLEIKNPKKRQLDLEKLKGRINRFADSRVEVLDLRKSKKDEVVAIKDAEFPKTYEVEVEFEKHVKDEKLKEVVRAFKGKTIEQKTPQRVMHRRADKVRKKKVFAIDATSKGDKGAVFTITGESGIYVKELIHGDEGRTKPSIAEYLDTHCAIKSLDVMKIHDNGGTRTW